MRVAVFDNYGEACLATDRLKDWDVVSPVVDTSAHATVAGAEQFYFIEVSQAEERRARAALLEMGYKEHVL